MSTVRDLIIDALQEIDIVGVDRDLDPDVAATALRSVRRMRDRFMAERLLLYTVDRQTFTLTAGQQTRTIGPGGNFDTGSRPRPLFLGTVTTVPLGSTFEYEVVSYRTREDWDREPFKAMTGQWPRRYRYEPGDRLGTFSFWPTPMTAAGIVIASPVALQALDADDATALATELVFPEGYEDAWTLVLAKRLQRPFEVPESQSLAADAREALGVIKRNNDSGPPASRSDMAIAGRGAWALGGAGALFSSGASLDGTMTIPEGRPTNPQDGATWKITIANGNGTTTTQFWVRSNNRDVMYDTVTE